MNKTLVYTIGHYQLRINIWLLIGFLLLQTLLNELGFWQLNRAKEKQTRIEQMTKGEAETLSSLESLSPQQIQQFQRVNLNVEVIDQKAIFLDNMTHNKAPGYHVLTIVREVVSGKVFLVNRGWIMAEQSRDQLPSIESPQSEWQLSGRIYPVFEATNEVVVGNVEHMQYGLRLPSLDQRIVSILSSEMQLPLESFIIRLDSFSEQALITDWVWTNMSVEKHLAYAIQWFGLALTLLIISIFVAIKKKVT